MGENISARPLSPDEFIKKATAETDEILGRVIKPDGVPEEARLTPAQRTIKRLQEARERREKFIKSMEKK